MLPIIGIVGGIGSGKSVVAEAMRKFGGYLIAADQLGHEALEHPENKSRLIQHFGTRIVDDQGRLDRKKLGRIVFADAAELQALEAVVLPYIETRIREEISRAQSDPKFRFVILDAAIMVEKGWDQFCDKIVYVDAPQSLRHARLNEKRGWDDKEIARRERKQISADKKRLRADTVVVNDEDFEKVSRQVQEFLEKSKII